MAEEIVVEAVLPNGRQLGQVPVYQFLLQETDTNLAWPLTMRGDQPFRWIKTLIKRMLLNNYEGPIIIVRRRTMVQLLDTETPMSAKLDENGEELILYRA